MLLSFTAAGVCAIECKATQIAGSALLFTGAEWSTIPDRPSLRATTALTIEMWIRPDIFGNLTRVLQKGDGQEVTSDRAYEMEVSPPLHPDAFAVHCFSGSPTGWTTTTANAVSGLGEWTHLAATYDSVGGRVRMYLNGVLRVEGVNTTGGVPIHEPIRASTYPIYLGCFNGTLLFFRGALDEVRIWTLARTPTEIGAHFDRAIDPQSAGLVGYWKFDEALGTQAIVDATLFHNDGYLGSASQNTNADPLRFKSGVPLRPACDGELTGDFAVDDADFVQFLSAYVVLLCDDLGMPLDCPADLNRDGVVDDADFVIFGQSYDDLVCP